MNEKTNNRSSNHSTERMWMMLLSSDSLDGYLNDIAGEKCFPRFADYISKLCRDKGKKTDEVLKLAGIERSYGYKLFAGTRKPSRDTALQLAFGFELQPDEAQQLLKIARVALLHPRIKRDAVIALCLLNEVTLVKTQIILQNKNLPLLGGKRNES